MNNTNGYTVKEMLGIALDKIDKIDEKRVIENKRIYDKLNGYVEQLKTHNARQDGLIKENKSHITENTHCINKFWKIIGATSSILTAGIVALFFKK